MNERRIWDVPMADIDLSDIEIDEEEEDMPYAEQEIRAGEEVL